MIEKAYNAKDFEDKIYKIWEESGFFAPTFSKSSGNKPFSISMPPPNATGTLHLGHAVMLAVEDLLARYHRMQGEPTLWLPGTDHAAIATQNKVEKLLAEKGLDRHKLGRKKFLAAVKKFVASSQNIIRNQIRKMGSSCDWSRERYTMDNMLRRTVNEVFIRMFKDKLIYRGCRIVNWCPRCSSTLADDEVEHREINGAFYYIKYFFSEDKTKDIIIATTRPETLLGDTAVAVNPRDKRYKAFWGKTVILPLINREIPVIKDSYVDMRFGTGALKVTPAHDLNDYEIGHRHNLDIINILNNNGTLNENAGSYKGLDRFTARKKIIENLKKLGFLLKTENHIHQVGHCYRCSTMIEPLTSDQWFIDVNKKIKFPDGKIQSLKEKAVNVVKKEEIKIVPKRFTKTYFQWINNLHDWCISRQIWWGHRIPVYYTECGETIASQKKITKCPKCDSCRVRQDSDTLDTWFSSGLWTFSTLGWVDNHEDFKHFHPTSVMETGYDILFFWVARMIIMTTYATGEIPFRTVYLHGLIRTREGKKMSKSDPSTCIDPLKMIDKYGADALRLSMIIGATPGNDTRLYEEKIAGARNFVNKLWNAARYVLMQKEDVNNIENQRNDWDLADKWILSRLKKLVEEVSFLLNKYQFSSAGEKIYSFLWNEYCDFYLEISKIRGGRNTAFYVLKTVLCLLHPFAPYVTEILWKELGEENLLMTQKWPKTENIEKDEKSEKKIFRLIEIVQSIRNLRAENKIIPSIFIPVFIDGPDKKFIKENEDIIKGLARISEVFEGKCKGVSSSNITSFGSVVTISLKNIIDIKTERKRLEKEIKNILIYIESINKKLKNSLFIKNAPKKIVEEEKRKKEKAEARLKKLKIKWNSYRENDK